MKRFILFVAVIAAAGCTSVSAAHDAMPGPPMKMGAEQPMKMGADRPSSPANSQEKPMMKMMMAMMPMSDLGPLAGCPGDQAPIPARIMRLHAALNITPAQETSWRAFADAYDHHAAVTGMDMSSDASNPVSAPDRIRRGETMMEAELASLRVLQTNLEALYVVLDAGQRSAADALKCKMGMSQK